MKFSENDFSWRDSFCFCGTTRNPHWLWLAARMEFRIFVCRQAFRLFLIFQKHRNRSKEFIFKQETPSAMQALKFYFLNHEFTE